MFLRKKRQEVLEIKLNCEKKIEKKREYIYIYIYIYIYLIKKMTDKKIGKTNIPPKQKVEHTY